MNRNQTNKKNEITISKNLKNKVAHPTQKTNLEVRGKQTELTDRIELLDSVHKSVLPERRRLLRGLDPDARPSIESLNHDNARRVHPLVPDGDRLKAKQNKPSHKHPSSERVEKTWAD